MVSSFFGTTQNQKGACPDIKERVPEFSIAAVPEGTSISQVLPHGSKLCHWWSTCNEMPTVLSH
jgi:hypothetical protein